MPHDVTIGEMETALTKADLQTALNSLFQIFVQPTEQGVIVQQKIGPVVIATITIPLEIYLQAYGQVKSIIQQKADIARAVLDVRGKR